MTDPQSRPTCPECGSDAPDVRLILAEGRCSHSFHTTGQTDPAPERYYVICPAPDPRTELCGLKCEVLRPAEVMNLCCPRGHKFFATMQDVRDGCTFDTAPGIHTATPHSDLGAQEQGGRTQVQGDAPASHSAAQSQELSQSASVDTPPSQPPSLPSQEGLSRDTPAGDGPPEAVGKWDKHWYVLPHELYDEQGEPAYPEGTHGDLVEVVPASLLTAERQRRGGAERERDEAHSSAFHWMARAEQAEKDRDEAWAELKRAHHEAMQGHNAVSDCAANHMPREEWEPLRVRLSQAEQALEEIATEDMEKPRMIGSTAIEFQRIAREALHHLRKGEGE